MRITTALPSAVAAVSLVAGVPAVQATEVATKQPSPAFSAAIKEGRKAARSALRQTKSTSISVSLVADGRIVWSQTFARGKQPARNAQYAVGSVSKTVTAIAIMQLVDAGKVSLDAPVVRYLPDFTMASPQYRQITVRMLLNHSAGLPGTDYADAISYKPIPSYVDRMLAGLRTSALKTTPGAMNVYCNDCFTLAGLVVQRVSGMPYEDYVAKNILRPLGMANSGFPNSVPAPKTVAPIRENGRVQPFQIPNIFAAGGMLSTSRDLARLAMIFTGDGVVAGKRILSSDSVAQMGVDQTTTTLRTAPPGGFRYGLGWDTVQEPALRSVGIRGWTKGGDVLQYHAGFMVAPDQDLAVTIVGAGNTFNAGTAETVGATVLLNALVETGAIPRLPKPVTRTPARTAATPAQVRRLTGIYLAENVNLKVARGKNRALKLSLLSEGKWVPQPGRFVRRADGAFWSTVNPGQSVRSVSAWDRRYLVVRSLGGTKTYRSDNTAGQRVRSGGGLSPAWQQRVGSKWLLTNEDASSVNWLPKPVAEITRVPGLSGYLLAQGAIVESVPFDATASDSVGSMFLQVPLLSGRDLYDFEFTGEYLRFSSSVLRQAATVPALVPGRNAVPFGPQGYVQWYRVSDAAQVTISGQSDWKLFDSDVMMVDSGGSATATKQAPKGAFLAVFGPGNAEVVVE